MLLWWSCPVWITILTSSSRWSNLPLCGSSSPHAPGIQVFSLAWSSFPIFTSIEVLPFQQEYEVKLPPPITVVLLFISHPLSTHLGNSYSFSTLRPYLWDSVILPWLLFPLSFCHPNFFTVFSWTVHLFPWHNNYWWAGILSPTVANSRCLEKNIRNRVRR